MSLLISILMATAVAQDPGNGSPDTLALFDMVRAQLASSPARWGPELLERADNLARLARDAQRAGKKSDARLLASRALAALPGVPPGLPRQVTLILGDGRPSHPDEAKALAISPSGNLMASGARDGCVKVWALPGGREVASFLAHPGEVLALAFGSDESILFSGGMDREAKVWSWSSAKSVGSFLGHTEGVTSLAVSRDGKRLATGSLDRKMRIFDISNRNLIAEGAGHTLPVNGLDFSPDGATVATASGDQKLRVFDAATGALRMTFPHFQGNHYAVRYLDGRTIALAGSRPGGVKLIDASSGAERSMLDCQADSVLGIAHAASGRFLATLSSDRVARLWELPAGKVVRSLPMDETGRAIALAPDGSRLAVATSQGVLRTWELGEEVQGSKVLPGSGPAALMGVVTTNSGTILSAGADGVVRSADWQDSQTKPFPVEKGPLGAMAASADGSWVAVGGIDRQIHLLRGPGLRAGPSLSGHQSTIVALAMTRDGGLMASADSGRNVFLWRPGEDRPLATWKESGRVPCALAFRHDGGQLAVASADGSVTLREGGTGRLQSAARGAGAAVLALAYSPSGELLAGGCADGRALIWETARPQATPAAFLGHSLATGGAVWNPVQSVVFRPDGKLVASAGADRVIRLWDPATRSEERALFGHSDWVTGLAFAPAGDGLASVGAGGETRLWKLESTPVESQPMGHVREVRTIAFSPDGKWLLSGGQDATLRMWDASTGRHMARFDSGAAAIQQVCWIGNDNWLAAGGDRQMRLWKRENPSPLRQFTLNGQGMANALQGIEGSRRAMVWVGDGQVEFHDLDGTIPRETWTCFEPGSQVTALSIGPKGHQVAIGGRTGQARLWDTRKRERVWKDDLPAHGAPVIDIALPEAETGRLATADTQSIKVWNISRREATGQIALPMGHSPRQLAISPKADRVAAACVDGHVRAWNADTGALLFDANFTEQLPHDKPFFNTLAFDPTGRKLAASGPGGRIYIMSVP